MNRFARISTWALAGLAFCALVWFSGGKEWVEFRLERQLTKPWLQFTVPDQPTLLNSEVKYEEDILTVCNRDNHIWESVRIRINGRYLTELGAIAPDRCIEIPIRAFHTESWKKLPAYKGLKVEHVEILVSLSLVGYRSHILAGGG